MNDLINHAGIRPLLRTTVLALLLPAALAGAFAGPAAAQSGGASEIRIAVSSGESGEPISARSLGKIRRQIAIAADRLCDTAGLAGTYRNGARRCRQRVIADAERQLEERFATRLAAR